MVNDDIVEDEAQNRINLFTLTFRISIRSVAKLASLNLARKTTQ